MDVRATVEATEELLRQAIEDFEIKANCKVESVTIAWSKKSNQDGKHQLELKIVITP